MKLKQELSLVYYITDLIKTIRGKVKKFGTELKTRLNQFLEFDEK